MQPDEVGVRKEQVNLRTVLGGGAVALLGAVLLYLSHAGLSGLPVWQALCRDLGSLLFVTVVLTLLWELVGKRAFLDEILAKARISKEISFSRVTQITDQFHHDIDWQAHLRSATKVDLFFAYAHTWRSSNAQELKNLAGRKGARLRVVLPDPEDDLTIQELARRFSYSREKLIGLIQEAETDFRGLHQVATDHGATVELWYLPAAPLYTYYRFDNTAVFTMYCHRLERASIPTFACETGGSLFEFFYREFKAIVAHDGLGHKVDLSA